MNSLKEYATVFYSMYVYYRYVVHFENMVLMQ
jgi:hypothetical protein